MDPHFRSRVRLYQVWKGYNRFACGGRLVFGPDGTSVAFSAFLIGIPSIVFCIKMYVTHGYRVLIVGIVLLVLDYILLFRTCASDPGIVPRCPRPPYSESSSIVSMDWLRDSINSRKIPRTREEIINGQIVRVKFCDTCMIYRPPRTSHCSVCNNCVMKFDHHCPWVGQCIGIRNYRFFILFVLSCTVLCIYIFTFTFIHVLNQKESFWRSLSRDILSIIILAYCFLSIWFVGGLSAFHLYLMCKNQTTYESFRSRYNKKKNPYNRGILNNLKEVFFTKIPPSLVNFREVVFEDEYYSTDSDKSTEALSRNGSKNVYPTTKNLNLIELRYSTKGNGKELKTGSFEIGPVSSPLDPEPRLKKWNSFNGETSFHEDSDEDAMFHRTISSYN